MTRKESVRPEGLSVSKKSLILHHVGVRVERQHLGFFDEAVQRAVGEESLDGDRRTVRLPPRLVDLAEAARPEGVGQNVSLKLPMHDHARLQGIEILEHVRQSLIPLFAIGGQSLLDEPGQMGDDAENDGFRGGWGDLAVPSVQVIQFLAFAEPAIGQPAGDHLVEADEEAENVGDLVAPELGILHAREVRRHVVERAEQSAAAGVRAARAQPRDAKIDQLSRSRRRGQ